MFLNVGIIVSSIFPLGSSDGYHVFAIVAGVEGMRWKIIKSMSRIIKEPKYYFLFIKDKTNQLLLIYFVITYSVGIAGCYNLLKMVIE